MVEDSFGMDWAIIATFAAVIVALGIGVYNGWRLKVLEKNRNKRELLKEIANWAVSLQLGPLEVEIPPTTMGRVQELALTSNLPPGVIDALIKGEISRIDAYVEFQKKTSFGKAISLGGYIRAIAEANFKKQLSNRVNEVIEESILSYFVGERSSGKEFDEVVKGFGGDYLAIMKRAEAEVVTKTKDLGALSSEYAKSQAKSVEDLLGEIARIID